MAASRDRIVTGTDLEKPQWPTSGSKAWPSKYSTVFTERTTRWGTRIETQDYKAIFHIQTTTVYQLSTG